MLKHIRPHAIRMKNIIQSSLPSLLTLENVQSNRPQIAINLLDTFINA